MSLASKSNILRRLVGLTRLRTVSPAVVPFKVTSYRSGTHVVHNAYPISISLPGGTSHKLYTVHILPILAICGWLPYSTYLYLDLHLCSMTKLKEHSREICYMVIWCYSQCLFILSTMSWVRGIFLRASTIFSAVANSSPPTEDFHICISCRAWIETLLGIHFILLPYPWTCPFALVVCKP